MVTVQQHIGLPNLWSHTSALACQWKSSLLQQQLVELEKPIGYGSFGVVWCVINPRTGQRYALKKIPEAFQSHLTSIRTLREVKIMRELCHDNLLSAVDFIHPPSVDRFKEVLVLSTLMETDLHQVIASSQHLGADHINVFMYQILRGLSYLHSAGIMHRDLKPGNLLVNSNCLLKICDFGFARALEPNPTVPMTQDVVTQYYRAPELLAGCVHYGTAVDMWSVGCIFAELLGRKILFEASTPCIQLHMITDLLGTPVHEDLSHLSSQLLAKTLLSTKKPPSFHTLYNLSPIVSHGAVHFLSQVLVFNPSKRISSVDALYHPFLDEGRIRYHTYLCTCCHTTFTNNRMFSLDLEPSCPRKFDAVYEKKLRTVAETKAELHAYIKSSTSHLSPLYVNTSSKQYKQFMSCTAEIQ